jgi:hypothetical protein
MIGRAQIAENKNPADKNFGDKIVAAQMAEDQMAEVQIVAKTIAPAAAPALVVVLDVVRIRLNLSSKAPQTRPDLRFAEHSSLSDR